MNEHLLLYFGDIRTSIPVQELASFDQKNYLAQLSLPLQACMVLKQTHGTQGHTFTDYETVRGYKSQQHEGDYIITTLTGVGIAVATADCLPIVLHDTRQNIIAVIHAGWRGSLAGIAVQALNHVRTGFGTHKSDVRVFFGPSAGVCCYEVDKRFVGPVLERDGRYYFDNKLFNVRALESEGVVVTPQDTPCTICDTRFCSYRRQGQAAQRQLTIVALV